MRNGPQARRRVPRLGQAKVLKFLPETAEEYLMKIAHFYPGLRYKSSIMDKKLFADRKVQQSLSRASKVLKKAVPPICQTNQLFESTQECFVVTLAATVAVADYYVQRYGEPDLIVASSFGHYAALVMASALDYQETLELAKNNGQAIDRYFSNHSTFLVRGISFPTIKQIISELGCKEVFTTRSDGFTITAPRDVLDDIDSKIRKKGGELEQIPLRLMYHTPFLGEVEKSTHEHFAGLQIRRPRIRFLSAFSAGFISIPGEIMHMLKNRISRPNNLKETSSVIKNEGVSRVVHMKTFRYD